MVQTRTNEDERGRKPYQDSMPQLILPPDLQKYRGRGPGVLPRIPPDSWGQLGRSRSIGRPDDTKTAGCLLSCRRICWCIEGGRPGKAWSGRASGNLRFGITLQTNLLFNPKNCKHGNYQFGRARMKSAHGAAATIGGSIAADRKTVQPAAARRLTGRAGSLPAVTDFQTHAAKLPRQAGAALFECRR